MLTPASLPELLPTRPILSRPEEGWPGVVLQRYRHPPSTIDVPASRDNLLVDHLVGPVLAENRLAEDMAGAKRCERRWTGPGQVSITPAGQPVHRILKGHPEVVLVHLASELLAVVADELFGLSRAEVSLVPSFGVPDDTADRIVRLLLAEAKASMPGTSLMAGTLARALAIHLLRCHSNVVPRTPEPPAAISVARFQRVIDYMRAHIDEALPLEQLAGVSGLSLSQFVRAFRDASGQPPHRFLIGLRMEKARELLERTDLPVIEVGLQCGFEQATHFATMFRKLTGFSPRAWRVARQS